MFAFLFRAIGAVLLAGAVVSAVLDITRSVAAGGAVLTPLGASWSTALPETLASLRAVLAERAALVAPLLEALLVMPTWGVLGVLAAVFFWIGRPRVSIASRFARE